MKYLLPLLLLSPAWANVPAAYFACEGAREDAPCRLVGGTHGNCVLDTLCDDDDPDTEVNECLLCVDGCWGSEVGSGCTRLTGAEGVCEIQDRYTDRPETSFTECNRCVEGEEESVAAKDGCQSTDTVLVLPWLLLLGLAARELRRRA